MSTETEPVTAPTRISAPLPFSATVQEAVRLSGLTKTDIYNLLNAGKIEARKRGRRTLVLMEGVRRYVEELPKARFGAGRM